jgi:hypothetical protein
LEGGGAVVAAGADVSAVFLGFSSPQPANTTAIAAATKSILMIVDL